MNLLFGIIPFVFPDVIPCVIHAVLELNSWNRRLISRVKIECIVESYAVLRKSNRFVFLVKSHKSDRNWFRVWHS